MQSRGDGGQRIKRYGNIARFRGIGCGGGMNQRAHCADIITSHRHVDRRGIAAAGNLRAFTTTDCPTKMAAHAVEQVA